MKTLRAGQITSCVDDFLGGISREDMQEPPRNRAREFSWDYAFSYFRDHPTPTDNMRQSCMELGYFLASWGMLRGSSYLFNHCNASHYRGAVRVIEERNPSMREIDADRWKDPDTQRELVDCYEALREALLPDGVTALTLVTKVMLGVWANVPAFDTYFMATFRGLAEHRGERGAFNRFGSPSLGLLADFYESHAEEIDGLSSELRVRDFSGGFTDHTIPRAKIIDMVGFQFTRLDWSSSSQAYH